MHKWEYLFVFAAITSEGGEFRPRFANDQELDDWQKGQPCTTMQADSEQVAGSFFPVIPLSLHNQTGNHP